MIRYLIIFFLLTGCTTIETRPLCWQNADYAAKVVRNQLNLKTRFLLRCRTDKDLCHVQSQAEVAPGVWHWIDFNYIPLVRVWDNPDGIWRKGEWSTPLYVDGRLMDALVERWDKDANNDNH